MARWAGASALGADQALGTAIRAGRALFGCGCVAGAVVPHRADLRDNASLGGVVAGRDRLRVFGAWSGAGGAGRAEAIADLASLVVGSVAVEALAALGRVAGLEGGLREYSDGLTKVGIGAVLEGAPL